MANVLLIEDNPDDQEVYRALLYYNGFEVFVAGDAKAGIHIAKSQKVDAIILDVMLPGMNGLIAAQNLSRDPATSRIPIICMSAYDVSPNMVSHSGAREFVSKPLTGDMLVRAIRKYIGWKDAPENPVTTKPAKPPKVRKFEVRKESSGWVVRDDVPLYLAKHGSRDQAVKDGHRIAQTDPPSELTVTDDFGNIVYHVSYPKDGPPVTTPSHFAREN